MTDDLVKRMRKVDEENMYAAPFTTKTLINAAADRIEALEAALREIACANDPDDPCTCQCQTECSYGIARIALAGEKKDE